MPALHNTHALAAAAIDPNTTANSQRCPPVEMPIQVLPEMQQTNTTAMHYLWGAPRSMGGPPRPLPHPTETPARTTPLRVWPHAVLCTLEDMVGGGHVVARLVTGQRGVGRCVQHGDRRGCRPAGRGVGCGGDEVAAHEPAQGVPVLRGKGMGMVGVVSFFHV